MSRPIWSVLGALCAWSLLSCGPQTPRASRPDPGTRPGLAPARVEAPRGRPAPAAVALAPAYSPVGKRDPFRSEYALPPPDDPGDGRGRTVLEHYELDQLILQAVVVGLPSPRAMVVTPDGVGHVLRRGTPIGKHRGRVADIRRNEVIIEETLALAGRRRATQRTSLLLRPR